MTFEAQALSLNAIRTERYTLTTTPSVHRGDDPEAAWLKIISSYRKPVFARSLYELSVTLIPFVLLWAVAAIAPQFGY